MPARSLHDPMLALARAWPYRSPAAFEHALPRLQRGKITALEQDFDTQAAELARGHGTAPLAAAREHAWFGKPSVSTVDLHEHLGELAERYLVWRGNAITLCDVQPGKRAEQGADWRLLSLVLPQDVLVAALVARQGVELPADERVELVDHDLAPILLREVAETHMHQGAALRFDDLWVGLLAAMGNAARTEFKDAPRTFDVKGYSEVLASAALIRVMLACYVQDSERGIVGSSFAAWYREYFEPRIDASGDPRVVRQGYVAAFASLRIPGAKSDVTHAQRAQAIRAFLGSPQKPGSLDELRRGDPLAAWLHCGTSHDVETQFTIRALRLLYRGCQDELFIKIFWQYVRVRTIVFGHLVQVPGRGGLDWFKTFYDRLSKHREHIDERCYESALSVDALGRIEGFAASEMRTSPPSAGFELRKWVRTMAEQACAHEVGVGRKRPEIGLILHFIKSEGDKRGPHAPPEGKFVGWHRYGRWYRGAMRQAQAIAHDLHYSPELLVVLRGLDIASSEMAIPNWPLVQVFERVRRAGYEAAARLAKQRPRWRVQPLRTTLHLGEDFRRLADALRRIHECVEFGLLRVGDRIGHGLALGWNVREWARASPVVLQSQDDRLDDLVWEMARYRAKDVVADSQRVTFVMAEIERLSTEVYNEQKQVSTLIEARKLRFDGAAQRRAGYPSESPRRRADKPEETLLHRYLTDLGTYQRGAELIEVHIDDDEVAFLERIQLWLRQQLALLGITIESNPSSNLLIGDFPDLREHPTFRLSPLPGSTAPLEGRLPVSINTDDPITFATCLADEYAHMYFALIGQGVPTRDALAWLDQAREAGWRSRFTLPASADPEVLLSLLGGSAGPRKC